jgi:pantothenate synthetase
MGLYKALMEAKMLVEEAGETDPAVIEQIMQRTMQLHDVDVDYAAVRHPLTLTHLDCVEPALTGGVVALVAGRLGNLRLLDNMLLGTAGERQ